MSEPNPLTFVRGIAERIGRVPGIVAVALGGSFARGEADENSDLDLGLYYDPASPPEIEALSRVARELDDRHPERPLTRIGDWGPWINGGGWLRIAGRRVDWLYRDLDRVAAAVADACAGRISAHYQPGHPHAFHSDMLMGEVHYARLLYDPSGRLQALQRRTTAYPELLGRAIRDAFLWEAGFALEVAAKSAVRGDSFHVAGCLFRSAACLARVLFALNRRYFVNEKSSVEAAGSFPLAPQGFAATVREVVARPGSSPQELQSSLDRMAALVGGIESLAAAADDKS